MTGNRDRFGERIEPIEDDDQGVDNYQVFTAPGGVGPGTRTDDDNTNRDPGPVWRTRDEIHHDRCAQLRAILRAAKARREVDQ